MTYCTEEHENVESVSQQREVHRCIVEELSQEIQKQDIAQMRYIAQPEIYAGLLSKCTQAGSLHTSPQSFTSADILAISRSFVIFLIQRFSNLSCQIISH